MTHILARKKDVAAWTPDLFGPIFKKEDLTLKKTIDLHTKDEQIHIMATFVPDEIIYGVKLTEKRFQKFRAVLMFLNISGFLKLCKKYIYDKNGGSLISTTILSNYIYIIVREIYGSEGDILKFSAGGLLAMWKIPHGKMIFNVVEDVIIHAMCIQKSIATIKNSNGIFKVNIAISAGDITFSIIGNDEARHFVIVGLPIEELKRAKNMATSDDVVLSLSAWQHCTPSHYEYVLKDLNNIKITKVLEQINAKPTCITSPSFYANLSYETFIKENSENLIKPLSYADLISIDRLHFKTNANMEKKASLAISTTMATTPEFSTQLKSYLIKPVIEQIEKNKPLKFLAEIRQITVISLDIVPDKCLDNELILLIDECFLLLHSIVTQYAGYINTVNLYDRNIFFCIVFGIRQFNDERQFTINETKNGLTCAMRILQTVKSIARVQSTYIGVSTGMAYCGVIGHAIRKYYAIIGLPVDKSIKIMDISYNMISCDYKTVSHSQLNKDQFNSRGMRMFEQTEKYHIYEYLGDVSIRKYMDVTSSLDYCYPILGRMQELDCFDDILDEIGVVDRNYSGMLIEGIERSGKSRLLDAFVTSVYNRQINPIKLSLHATYADKAHAVIYHIILELLEALDCDTVEERERVLFVKLSDVLTINDFCYLNILLRVRFPLSDTYCSDSDRQRHMKTISIFETILKHMKTNICILLDDIQYIDHMSWQFLSSALNIDNIIVAMTMLKLNSVEDLSDLEMTIYNDKRLMKYTLHGLDSDLLPALTCQFLNVLAIPIKLSRFLQKRKDGHIGWCEAFLTLTLQNDDLNFIRISPNEVEQRDFVFPNASLLTKLPSNLTPEEVAPPLHWSQMDYLDICIMNNDYFQISNIYFDMKELMIAIYNKMNPYEQSFIMCAASLGKVFKRSALEYIMPNSIPPHTTKAISEMMRIHILECASLQRRNFEDSEILTFCTDKKRRTFSDMHHLLSCYCHISQITLTNSSSSSDNCRMLEFKVNLFQRIIYDLQSNEMKQEHHVRATNLYNRDAKKCDSCGSGRFLRIPHQDIFMEKESPIPLTPSPLVRRRIFIKNQNNRSTIVRRHLISTKANKGRKRKAIDINKVSIMPTTVDDEEEKVPKNQESIERTKFMRFWQRPMSIAPETAIDPSHPNCLEKFSHIDYCNCQCDNIINILFWKLHQHIECKGGIDKILDFILEYSAGLILTAQPLYAIKLLSIAAERHKAAKMDDLTNKGIILALTGDAYSAMGKYAEAKKYYRIAVKLRDAIRMTVTKPICYSIILKMFCIMQISPHDSTKLPRKFTDKELILATYLRRLSIVFMIENKLKMAELYAMKSFKLAFLSGGNILEKGEIYLATIQILYRTKNIKLTRRIEKLILTAIKSKTSWNTAEEITMVANIYLAMYQIRLLRGKLENAIEMGIKVLNISKTLHCNELMLIILPSLIQIMVWTKRINKAVDLMRELYFLAQDDVDLSAKTWYYALSLELILDAGVVVESYESSHIYYKKFITSYKSQSCIWRDPESIFRLLTCLWMYQLRMGRTTMHAFVYSAENYMQNINSHDFSRIVTCSKGLECYLLMLMRCINIKYSHTLIELIENIYKIIKCLQNVSNYATVIKPYLYLLMAYLNLLRSRKISIQFNLRRAQKFATLHGNKLILAWIIQNKRTWKEKTYNNMARYWVESVGSSDIVAWQYICNFNINTWSTILHPLMIADSHL